MYGNAASAMFLHGKELIVTPAQSSPAHILELFSTMMGKHHDPKTSQQRLITWHRHGHDGTTEVNLMINGKLFCNSTQYYGLRPTTTQPLEIAMQHGDSHTNGMQYISDAVACEDEGRIEKGDVLWTEAYYNASKYPQMVFKGHVEAVSP